MFDARYLRRMTPAQRHHIAMLGVQARELIRLQTAPEDILPIPKGLQLAALVMDLRFAEPVYHHSLLFQWQNYQNRYQWVMDNKVQNRLAGWHHAFRSTAELIRPVRME